MRFVEFGDKKNPKILLIHGYGISWKMWTSQINVLQKDYQVILPVLDGHDEENNSDFISIQESAQKIINYIEMNYNSSLFAICGSSLGGTIAFEILAQNRLKVEKAIIDAGPAAPFSKLFIKFSIIYRSILNYLIRKRNNLAIKQLENSYLPKEAVEDAINICSRMSSKTYKNVYLSCFTYELPLSIKDTKTDILYWYGSKEAFLFKKSVKFISQTLPNVKIEVFKGYNHGELCIGNPSLFLEKCYEFFKS